MTPSYIDIKSKGLSKTEADTRYLKLDQSFPQTVTASPILNWGTATRIPFYSATKTLSDSANLTWDNTNGQVNINAQTAKYGLAIRNAAAVVATQDLVLYTGTDPQNAAVSAGFIKNSVGTRRLFFGDATNGLWALNFQYVTNWESVPYLISMQSGAYGTPPITASIVRGASNVPLSLEGYSNGVSGFLTGGLNAALGHRDVLWRSYYDPTDAYPAYASCYTYDTISNAAALGSADHTTWRVAASTVIAKLSNAGALTLGSNLIMTAGTDIRPTADSTTALNIAQADGTDFVTFDTTNKRVGIGVTPSYKLDLLGQFQALVTTGVGFGVGYRSSSWIGGVSGNPAMMLQNGSGKWCFVDLSSGTMEVINGGNYDLVLGANNSVYAYVKSDGKFGIMTSSPSAQLEVTTSGQLALRMNRTVTNGSFRYDFNAIDDPSETQYPGYTAYANLEAYLGSTRIPFEFAPGIMAIKTGAAQWAMFLDDNQNIYLGTNTDDGTSSRLQTNGTVSALTGGFISQMTSDLTIDGSMWYRTDLYELRFRLDGVTYRANVSPIS